MRDYYARCAEALQLLLVTNDLSRRRFVYFAGEGDVGSGTVLYHYRDITGLTFPYGN